ncbi:MAG: DUF362 domain-containing protein [Chloroflexota bacterium]
MEAPATVLSSPPPGTSRAKVAVLYTQPKTVLKDIDRLLHLADFERYLPKGPPTVLKINISWQHYFPACSTTPWQLEGTIKSLQAAGYGELVPTHNSTVVVDAHQGEAENRLGGVLARYGLKSVHLEEPPVRWIPYRPRAEMLVLDKVYPRGLYIPDLLMGKNIVHLPTMKTHVFTTITGAMKNAFGGLLNYQRHWAHAVIHETLVDLLAIQKEIHPGIMAVMDGTFVGEGPGPRAMRPHVRNVLLASADQVAIDAVAAHMMGFDPLSLKFLRLAQERGLGTADLSRIQVVGEDISQVDWHFSGGEETLASRGQKLIYWGPLKPLEGLLLRSPLVPLAYFASNLYFNHFWYRFIGQRRVREALKTGWGRLFRSY